MFKNYPTWTDWAAEMSFIRVGVSHQELAADLVAVLSSRSASQCSAAGRIVAVVCLQPHPQLSSCRHQSQQAASLDYCCTHTHTHSMVQNAWRWHSTGTRYESGCQSFQTNCVRWNALPQWQRISQLITVDSREMSVNEVVHRPIDTIINTTCAGWLDWSLC